MTRVLKVKQLRSQTGFGLRACVEALDKADGDLESAMSELRSRPDRPPGEPMEVPKVGRVFQYLHHNGRLAATVVVYCDTDFLANSAEFTELGMKLARQAAAVHANDVYTFLEGDLVWDESHKANDLLVEVRKQSSENVRVGSVCSQRV